MTKSIVGNRYYTLFFTFSLLLSSSASCAQTEPDSKTLEQQIIAAQQTAKEVQTQLSPNDNTSQKKHGGKMKGMKNMSQANTTLPQNTTSQPASMNKTKGMGKNGMGKMNNMAAMGKKNMMGKKMSKTGNPAVVASLPSFPGNTHIYHVGSVEFFLDKIKTVNLTEHQQELLMQLQSRWQKKHMSYDENTAKNEQALWLLTAEAVPNATAIKEKMTQVANIEVTQRLFFIRSVGEAAEILTEQQRQILTKEYALVSAK